MSEIMELTREQAQEVVEMIGWSDLEATRQILNDPEQLKSLAENISARLDNIGDPSWQESTTISFALAAAARLPELDLKSKKMIKKLNNKIRNQAPGWLNTDEDVSSGGKEEKRTKVWASDELQKKIEARKWEEEQKIDFRKIDKDIFKEKLTALDNEALENVWQEVQQRYGQIRAAVLTEGVIADQDLEFLDIAPESRLYNDYQENREDWRKLKQANLDIKKRVEIVHDIIMKEVRTRGMKVYY